MNEIMLKSNKTTFNSSITISGEFISMEGFRTSEDLTFWQCTSKLHCSLDVHYDFASD